MLSDNSLLDFKLTEEPLVSCSVTPKLSCSLRWRQGKLWVSQAYGSRDIPLPALASEEWFRACLNRSRAKAVCIDPTLGNAAVTLWAKACKEAGKPLYVRIPSTSALPHKQNPLGWMAKRLCDQAATALLLVILSPLMLVLAGLIKLQDGGPIFYCQWRVGQRGKLFRIFKFRSMVVNAENLHYKLMADQRGLHKLQDDPRVTPLGKWIRKFSLDELPQLLNVWRGEMSLVGPRPWAIYDAVRIAPELRHRLNALPGMTGAWQVEARSTEVDLTTVNRRDLAYLKNWTVWQDLKFLLLTVPKVLLGSGAY
ncbi:heterocyst development glycosyltransferase HepC [Pseudanabaena sp. FACHB-2040]|uniref:heterocyst development glycosyltransferase HepC n=1 Tax=Pseudanabaena sp. FACHB-2040 TaxID=2692859 RepID=UPI0016832390|nr:heterocyst development glycosyltransferase HepC [Pseudanabaena sp. FACHB-2040]MBD2260569.1 sugar transferase [Pseudanabaena sp. FACHB-2040]